MKELKLLLRVLITPSIWFCYGAYCKTWDGLIREQLIDNVAVDFDMETVGNVVIDLDSNYFGTSKKSEVYLLRMERFQTYSTFIKRLH